MPIVDIPDFETYGKAIAYLLRRGAMIEARDESKLILTPAQEEALIEAGILDANGSYRTGKRAAKAKKKKKA